MKKEAKTGVRLRQLDLFSETPKPEAPGTVGDREMGARADETLEAIDFEPFPKKKSANQTKFGVADLSEDQTVVYNAVVGWLERTLNDDSGHKLLTVGGFAGTGKSSILGVFAAEHKHLLIAFATYTGRAASVLQRKLREAGVHVTSHQAAPADYKGYDRNRYFLEPWEKGLPFCGTLHKLLYRPVINDKEEVIGWRDREELDRDYDLIVVDESSMISDDMLLDLQRFGIPILAVGDHGQLPPVMASGNLMAKPDLKLVNIHRQAKKNPIIVFARHARRTGELSRDFEDGEHVVFDLKRNVDSILRRAYADTPPMDVAVLCWTNRQRIRLNLAARRALGFRGAPEKGEVLICLKNMQGTEIYNGMRGLVTADSLVQPGEWEFDCDVAFPEEGLTARTLPLCGPQFNRERVFSSIEELEARGVHVQKMGGLNFFDFGYALTVHRSQGSQMKHVIFYVEEGAKADEKLWKRLAYTAITRASKTLTILL
jgi:exodeoxyribonuclease V